MTSKLGEVYRTLNRGFFLEPDAFDEVADGDNTFVEGMFLVVIVGLVVAIASIIGNILGWATTPDLDAMQEIVLKGLQDMPMMADMWRNPQATEIFHQQYEMGWNIARFMAPNPVNSLAGLLLIPLRLIISWLWFAIIAQGMAKALGGNGSLQQTLGAAALATAPGLLNVFQVLPTIMVAAVGTLMLLARYIAIRRVHENLSWGRVLFAVIVPYILLGITLLILFILLIPIMGILFGGIAL